MGKIETMFTDRASSVRRPARSLVRWALLFHGLSTPLLWAQGGPQQLGPGFLLAQAGSLTTNPAEVIAGKASIKGAYSGTSTYTTFLQTNQSVVSFSPNHPYQVSFQYKILTAAPNGLQAFFNSQIAQAQGTPSDPGGTLVRGNAGTTGTATFTATLGAFSDYTVLWGINGTGAISVDNIQIMDGVTGEVLAAEDAERTISVTPTVSMTIRVKVPSNTLPNDALLLYTGTLFPPSLQIPMSRVTGTTDTWQATISRPPGTIFDYAVAHNNHGGVEAYVLVGSWNNFVYRKVLISDGATVSETVAQWVDLPKPDDSLTGTLTGTVKDQAGNPLTGIWISAGPHQTVTDTDGNFIIYDIPAGPCTMTVQSENGEFVAVNVTTTIAANGTTVQDVALAAAAMSTVTFHVTVPANTPAGAVPRLYGDTYRLGMVQIPSDHPAPDTTRMIDMGPAGGNQWSFTVQLGTGSCVNYLYTLGSYRLNYERDYQGNALTRALCVNGPMTVTDEVIAWKTPQQVPVSLTVASPTGAQDALYVATDDAGGTAPVKMWPTGPGQAAYTIYVNPSTTLNYHYIRNADPVTGPEIVGTDSNPPAYRSIAVGPNGAAAGNDTVIAWRHQMREPALSTVTSGITDPIVRTAPFQTGIELIDYWRSNWLPLVQPTLARIQSANAQWVQINANWSFLSPAKEDLTTYLTTTTDPPKVEPRYNDFPQQDLLAHIRAARAAGLHVALTVQPYPNGFAGAHTSTWYDQFFQQVQSTFLDYSRTAQQEGVEMLILGNLSLDADNNNDSATRIYVNTKWKQIIAAIRAGGFTGKLASQGGANLGVPTRPEYDWYADLDYIGVFWEIPIGASSTDTVQTMYQQAILELNSQFQPIYNRFNKPIIFTSVMFYSASSSSLQTYQLTDPRISPHEPADPSVPSDYDEQGRAYQALFRALAATPWVQGAYPFAYWYWDFDSKGYSIRGKTAENIVSQIYQQINAAVNPVDGSPSCKGALDLSGQAFPAFGGNGTVNVTAAVDCNWTVRDVPAWLSLTSAAGGAGNGSLTYQVLTNPGAARSADFTIAGLPFTVEQASASIAGSSLTGSLSHVTSGGTWEFALTALNLAASTAQTRFTFTGDDGNPAPLPLTFPQSTPAAPELATTLDRTLNGNAQLVIESRDAPQAIQGWAQLTTTGTVGAFGIFSNPTYNWEAVVPLETRNAANYVLPFDNTGSLATGVAVANVAGGLASITVTIRDDSGKQIGASTLSLPALGHTSFMLNQQYPATVGKRGAIEFDTPPSGPISLLGLRANGPSITTLPVLANVSAAGGSVAHVVFGGGYANDLTLVNTGAASASATLAFFANDGSPLVAPLYLPQTGESLTSSTLTRALAPGASLLIQAQPPASSSGVEGWAQLTATGSVSGFGIFRWMVSQQETSVPLEPRNAPSYVLVFDNTNTTATGLAVSNLSGTAADITVKVRDDTGTLLQSAVLSLPVHGHTSFMLPDHYPSAANIRGTVEFVTPAGGRISVIGLRARNGNLTTIPVMTK